MEIYKKKCNILNTKSAEKNENYSIMLMLSLYITYNIHYSKFN